MTNTKTEMLTKALGRRKTAAARVRLMPGKGTITINGKKLEEYFPVKLWQEKVIAPLKTTSRDTNLDVSVKVAGGGVVGQANAVRHGIARALVNLDETFKKLLKAEGFLTRDSRMVERKKFGKISARRGHQWRKR
jgi:small subunit ribosomal protein S9